MCILIDEESYITQQDSRQFFSQSIIYSQNQNHNKKQ